MCYTIFKSDVELSSKNDNFISLKYNINIKMTQYNSVNINLSD